jgi:hypothetical protein
MKKILSTICCLVILLAFVLGGAEKPDGSCDLLWTCSWLGVAAIAGFTLKKLEGKRNV